MAPSDPSFLRRLVAAEFGGIEATQPLSHPVIQRDLHEAGRRLATRWALEYEPLVKQYENRPDALFQLFGETIQAHLFGQGALRVVVREGSLRAQWTSSLPTAFRAGFLQGLASACATDVRCRTAGADEFTVSWASDRTHGSDPRWLRVLQVARLPFLAATIVPVLVGLAVAASDGWFSPLLAAETLVGVLLFQLATYTLHDAIRPRRDTPPNPFTPFSGLAAVLGMATDPSRQRVIAAFLYLAGTVIGLHLVAVRGLEVLWLGLTGTLLGALYSAPPIRLAHRGLGELAVAVAFGPLIVVGTHYVQTTHWSPVAFVASLPVAFVIATVLYLSEFPDKDGDARVGKRTLIVRLPERAAVIVYLVLTASTYVAIAAGVALAGHPATRPFAFPAWTLSALVTLPLAFGGALRIARNFRFPYRLTTTTREALLLQLATGLLFSAGFVVGLVA